MLMLKLDLASDQDQNSCNFAIHMRVPCKARPLRNGSKNSLFRVKLILMCPNYEQALLLFMSYLRFSHRTNNIIACLWDMLQADELQTRARASCPVCLRSSVETAKKI